MCAVYAHLYIAWLHPFGDGNGRTARRSWVTRRRLPRN
ncbi:Fic family protein [Candidatus Poriferisodalis sp.]